MFKNLTNFAYQRNWKEAVGFYLAYLLLCVTLGMVAGALFGGNGSTFLESFRQGVEIGIKVSSLSSLVISALFLKEKNLFRNFGYLLLAAFGGVLATFGGSLLGLIVPAYLSTREAINTEK